MTPVIYVLLGLLSAALALINAMILFHLRRINIGIEKLEKRIDAQDGKITNVISDQNICKKNCYESFVDKVDFVRAVTKSESTNQELLVLVSELKGSMKLVEQMPAIAGNIAREVVKEMRQ